jgi:23S rRNA (cytosine1962-C5)-methyltransferase
MAKVYICREREKKVDAGHPWIYRSDIEKFEGEFEPGDVVDILNYKGKFLGRGYINLKSVITVRVLTTINEQINYDFFYKRIKAAWDYRKLIDDTNSCRVIFGESDFLPALIVDKFADVLVLQSLSYGIERFKEMIADILMEIIHPIGIYERSDVHVRDLEGLPQQKGFLRGNFPTSVKMVENGIVFLVDIENGQKTGFFLDQKENRAAIAPFVKDKKVLDCFTHTGSFALHAGYYGANDVLGIDISDHAVECATANAKLNNLESVCKFKTANTFDILRDFHDTKTTFETIILDPPAFTKSKSAVEGAIRGYKEINLRAMKIIESGGFLITCSCSHHIDKELFLDILHTAGIDSKRKIKLVEYRSQSKDHPILLASEETEYLKCAILQIV